MASITNLMKRNPGMTAAGIIFLIALIVVIIWLVTGGQEKKVQAGPGAATSSVVPELEVSGVKTVKSVKTSGYTYEYALGDFIGDNIDFTITVKTKGGFEESGIIELLIKRTKPDGTLLESQTIPDIKNYKTYTVKFMGDSLTEDAYPASGDADNTFKVFGVTTSATGTAPAVLFDADAVTTGVQELATSTQTVSKADLNHTPNTMKNSTFTFDMSAGTTGIEFSSDIKRTVYVLSIDPSKRYKILIDTTNTDQYILEATDGTKLTVDNISSFKMDKIGNKYRFYSGDKFITRTGGTGALKLAKPHEMTPEEAETSMITLSEDHLFYGGKFWLVYPKSPTEKEMFWPVSFHSDNPKLPLRSHPMNGDTRHMWEIVPSGKNDNKYWLVYPKSPTENEMFWPVSFHSDNPKLPLRSHPMNWDTRHMWEIVPSGKNDNKYWLVYPKSPTENEMFWPVSFHSDNPKLPLHSHPMNWDTRHVWEIIPEASYVKAADNYDRYGGDINFPDGAGWKDGFSLNNCQYECTMDPDCIGITYNAALGRCFKKGNTAAPLAINTHGHQWYDKK